MASSECARCGRCGNKVAGTEAAQACGNSVDQDGHGTHVAGTIAGKSITSTTPATDAINGIAAGASLFFQDIHNDVTDATCKSVGLDEGCGGWLNPPSDLYYLFKPALDAGARIHSNSWGCATDEENPFACNVYSNNARQIDNFVNQNQDFVVVVAAGNDGALADGYTVGDPATCKNCLSVGATQLNADQVQADAQCVTRFFLRIFVTVFACMSTPAAFAKQWKHRLPAAKEIRRRVRGKIAAMLLRLLGDAPPAATQRASYRRHEQQRGHRQIILRIFLAEGLRSTLGSSLILSLLESTLRLHALACLQLPAHKQRRLRGLRITAIPVGRRLLIARLLR